MKRILFIIDGLRGGGKERQLFEINKQLKLRPEFIVGTITFNKNKHYSGDMEALTSFYVELSKRPTRLEPFLTIWKHIRRFNPDIIHTWDSLSSFYSYLPAKIFRIKTIDGSIRDAGADKGWQLYLKKFFLKRANLVLSNSYAGLNYYGLSGEINYNAININRFHENTNDDCINIIMVANFTDYKDHSTFIRASLELVKIGIVNHVYLAGEGPNQLKYYDHINKNFAVYIDRFSFLGSIKNVEEYLSKCTFGILCSTSEYAEGISNSVLEYMAAGLIAISTDVGGMKEVIEDGVNGFLVDPGDSTQIVNIIMKLANDKNSRKKIINDAKITISTKFSYENNINRLADIYSNLCSSN